MNGMSLFTGIGGLDIAAGWAGITTRVMVEWDKKRQQWLRQLFPDAALYGDIDNFNEAENYAGHIDIIFGGEPCQGNSVAGLREGFNDPRFKWPQYLRTVKAVRPAWVVNENVSGSISNGVLDQKISDLEAIGYTCWPPLLIPAGAAGAIHRRDRVWLVAYTMRTGRRKLNTPSFPAHETKGDVRDGAQRFTTPWPVRGYASKSEILSDADGFSAGFSATYRNAAIEAAGNAVMPHHAYPVFHAIQDIEARTLRAPNT
jgi:DNA (cytosine-5)-methyltransferase 1